jgi:hypothetical protein
MEPCIRYGREYLPARVSVAPGGSTTGGIGPSVGAPPTTARSTVGSFSSHSTRSRAGGSDSTSDHVAARASAWTAEIATSSRSATTATKLPLRTTSTTPERLRTAPSSRPCSSARGLGGRSTRAWSMPGMARSCTNLVVPSTIPGRSIRGPGRPTYRCWYAGFGGASPVTATSNDRPPSSSQ